jgi:uncharacterized protein YdhG (YjbR/CyaY superfamily)
MAKTKAKQSFTAEERAAMRERAKELKAQAGREAEEKACLAAIAKMSDPDRSMAKKVHALLTKADLASKTWYGMPAYTKDGNVICFFKPAEKFGARYATLGFTDNAKLDDGDLWPTEFAVRKLGAAEENKIAALVKKALR